MTDHSEDKKTTPWQSCVFCEGSAFQRHCWNTINPYRRGHVWECADCCGEFSTEFDNAANVFKHNQGERT